MASPIIMTNKNMDGKTPIMEEEAMNRIIRTTIHNILNYTTGERLWI